MGLEVSYKDVLLPPTGSQKPFQNGIWIKVYNGATVHWMVWYNRVGIVPSWKYTPENPENPDYVKLVCDLN